MKKLDKNNRLIMYLSVIIGCMVLTRLAEFGITSDQLIPVRSALQINGVRIAAGAISATGTASPVTVTGLTNNTTYSCSVRATNIAGPGLPSATVSVTPVNVPIVLSSTTNVAGYGASVTLIASVTGNAQTGTASFSVSTANGPVALPGCSAVPLVAGMAISVIPSGASASSTL